MAKILIALFSLALGIYNVYNFYKQDKENENCFLYQEKKQTENA